MTTTGAGRVLVGGEVLVDLVPGPADGADGLGPLVPSLGGGPFNVAVALGRLGVPTGMLTRASTDPFGDALVARLAAHGVDTAAVQRGPEPTSLAVVALADDGSARYAFYVEGTADRLVADPGPLPDDVAALALGGLSLLLEPGASVYGTLLEGAARAGRLVSLDPNIRTALITDPAAHRARLRSWLPAVGLLKLSDEDADWWGGDPEDWVAAGAGAVVLTRGADGLVAHTRAAGRVAVPAEPAGPVVDTIGAGDTAHAALLSWFAEHGLLDPRSVAALDADGWRAALGRAARAAGIVVARRGADPPTRDELAA